MIPLLLPLLGGKWVKAALIALALAAVFGAGWKARSVVADAARAAELAAVNKRIVEVQAEVDAQRKEQDARARATVEKYQTNLNRFKAQISRLKAEARNAQVVVAGCDQPFSHEFVRLFDSATVAAGGGEAGVPADPGGTAGSDRGATDVAPRELIDVHTEQMRICGEWKRRLDNIRQWDKETFE